MEGTYNAENEEEDAKTKLHERKLEDAKALQPLLGQLQWDEIFTSGIFTSTEELSIFFYLDDAMVAVHVDVKQSLRICNICESQCTVGQCLIF